MNPGNITCPKCGHAFELSDALTHQIRDHLKIELQADITRRETEAKRKLDEVKTREEALGDEVEKQLKRKLVEAEAKEQADAAVDRLVLAVERALGS